MLRTIGKTVGSALAVLCLVSTLAVAADPIWPVSNHPLPCNRLCTAGFL